MAKKGLLYIGSALLLLVVGGFLTVYAVLAGSTPLLNGSYADRALASGVTIERDERGVPTIGSESRADIAYGTGFVHAQERFFQMDVLRRLASGHLAELFGDEWMQEDRENRVHDFERVAAAAYRRLPQVQRELIDAYARGVNAGLNRLAARPVEYYLLGAQAREWRPEDTLLVVMAFYIQLQGYAVDYERSLDLLDRRYGREFAEFLTPARSAWNAPLDVDREVASLSGVRIPLRTSGAERSTAVPLDPGPQDVAGVEVSGSNAWLISANRVPLGSSVLANDMHLRLATPNIFYKVSLRLPSGRAVTGVTIPGFPFVLAGTNGDICWGLTNAMLDSADLVRIKVVDADHYEGTHGSTKFERAPSMPGDEGPPVLRTEWGPVVGSSGSDRLALRWTAHLPDAYDFQLHRLETAEDVDTAIRIAKATGFPQLNFLVADRRGGIGWTIMGRLPKRVGFSGKYPQVWSESVGWRGWLDEAEHPAIVDPPQGLLWSANSAPLEGEGLEKLGIGSAFDEGVRTRLIRDALVGEARIPVARSLALQLDTHSAYMEQWRRLLLSLLTPARIAAEPGLADLKAAVASSNASATPDSAGYRLVRRFQQNVERRVRQILVGEVGAEFGNFDFEVVHADAIWAVLTQKPAALLPEGAGGWDELLFDILHERVFRQYEGRYASFAEVKWGEINRSQVRHPLSGVIPFVGAIFDMPEPAIAGDSYTVLNNFQNFGPAVRMVLVPGREESSTLTMPVGEASNPLTPYYGAGHREWLEGTPLPLLPGRSVYRLELRPAP